MSIRIVPERSRMTFLPKHFGRSMMRVENRVYAYAERALEGYKGGLWDFAEAENGAGFMIPPKPSPNPQTLPGLYRWRVTEFSGGKGMLSPEAAGIALMTLTLNHEWNRDPDNERLGHEWEKLMELSRKHPEREVLWGILD